MKLRSAALVAAVAACVSFASAQTAPPAPPAPGAPGAALKTDKERMGYALGLQIGSDLKGLEVDDAALSAGIKDAMAGNKPKLTDKEITDSMAALRTQAMAREDAKVVNNQKAGDDYLAANGKKEGVKTTASGLQYKVIKSGTGKSPKATDTVSVNYRGTLTNGKEFDSSSAHGGPASFPVNQVIPGWTEALQLMKEGDKWQLTVPAKLAYAERGAGPDIGPNEVLIFEVELLKVEAAK